jgi:hypothetical protein
MSTSGAELGPQQLGLYISVMCRGGDEGPMGLLLSHGCNSTMGSGHVGYTCAPALWAGATVAMSSGCPRAEGERREPERAQPAACSSRREGRLKRPDP